MQYLVDGHNLIPYVPGISLADIDDEDQLIKLLQIHGRVTRSRIEVFFDKAPAGKPRIRKVGMVTVHSIPEPAIADTAIIRKVQSLGKATGGYSVVSHDREVQSTCRRLGARIVDSPDFAHSIQNSLRAESKRSKEQPEVDALEVDAWLKMFEEGNTTSKNQD